MRQTIELLRKQSIQAGLTSAHMQSMGVQVNVNGAKANGNGSPTKATNGQKNNTEQNGSLQRHHSTDSMCSVNSNGSNGSSQDKKKKKGWVS
jgi:neuron navigator 2